MLDNFARSVQILIELVGNPEQRLTEINRLTDQLNNKKIGLTDAVSGLAGGANNAAGALGKVASSTQDVASKASDLSGKSVSAFGKIKESVLDLNNGVQTLAASLAGIAMGGAISGLSWKASADFKLINEQIDDALAANKKLGITKEEMDAFVQEQAESGEGTRQDTKSEIYSVLMASQKYLKGNSLSKLNQADAITDFWFSKQEIMKQQGISSPEQLIRMTTRSEGKMIGTQLARFQTATGASEKDAGSAKSRMKFLTGQETDMKTEMDKRPWEAMLVAVTQLKYAIGDGLAPVMSVFIKMLTGAVKLLNSIPGAAPLIGLAGAAIAFVSTLTLLNGVLSPGISLLKQMVVWTNLHTAAQVKDLVVSKARIVTDWLGITSLGARTVATAGLTTATLGLAAAEWAALSPLLLLAVPLIAVAGLLYLAETRTHVFSNALDKLSKTEMSKDLIKWLEDVGYWAGYAVDRLGSVIESDLFSKIENLNSAYTNVKSGNFAGQMLGSVSGMPGTNLLTMTKIVTPLSLMQNHLEFIVNVLSWFKNFFSGGNPLTNIYNAIIRLPANIYKAVSEWVSKQIEKVTTKFSEITKFFGDINTGLSTKFGEITSDISTKYNEIITTITTKITDIISTITTKFEGITTTITTKFNDIITSIKSMLPGWMKGSDSGNAAGGSEEGFIKFIRETKKGSENYFKYGQLSDETLRAAYREGQTGVPQPHENLTDPYEYDNIVKYAVPEYAKSGASSSTASLFSNIPTGNLSPHETEINRHEGDIDYEASKQKGITAGYILPEGSKNTGPQIDLASIVPETNKEQGWTERALNMIGFADGGFVQKTGFALVHEGEPIIPADVASSSRLQNILEGIAYGGSSSNTYGDINVRINYTSPTSSASNNMIVMDRISFEHMVSDIIAKRLRQLNGY